MTDYITLPLPISHLCENYLPLPISHLYEFYMCTCINCNGDISLHAGLKKMVSDMDAMFSCIFNLCDVRMRITISCVVPRDYFMGPP